jgi:hypothetical protein
MCGAARWQAVATRPHSPRDRVTGIHGVYTASGAQGLRSPRESSIEGKDWSGRQDSNLRPSAPKADGLTKWLLTGFAYGSLHGRGPPAASRYSRPRRHIPFDFALERSMVIPNDALALRATAPSGHDRRGLRWWTSIRLAHHRKKDHDMIKTRLTDLQSVLLSAASRHEAGSVLPVAASVAGKKAQVRKALGQLLKRGLIAEIEQPPAGAEWRSVGDLRCGLVLTERGLAAIGVITTEGPAAVHGPVSSPALSPLAKSASAQSAKSTPTPTKTTTVIALLGRQQGATLAELVEATGWLPHTTRAALTGLRQKGHALMKGKRGDATCYTIAKARA